MTEGTTSTALVPLEVLGTLTAAINRATDESIIYEAALDALETGLNVARASILLFDADGVMRFTAWRGLSDDYRQAVEGHTPWRPDTRDADIISVPDVSADASLRPFLPTIQREGIAAMVFVPLTALSGVIGKCMLYLDEPSTLPPSALSLARLIATQVAFAIQRTRAERARRNRDTELQLVADLSPVYIAHCDRDRRYKFVNRPFATRFNLEPADIVGRTIDEVVGDAASESFREFVEGALAGCAVEFEMEVPYKTIGARVVHGEYAPEFDATGQVSGFVAVLIDVTERHRLEEARHATEALFRQLAASLPHIVWMAGSDGRIYYYNERWYEFTGFPRGETGTEAWVRVLHPDDVERSLAGWGRSVETGTPYEIEYRLFDRQSHSYRWQLARALPVRGKNGEIARWFGTTTDIDDQKRAEQASRFLANASRMLSALVDYPTGLEKVAALAVPDFADWCAVDIVEPDGPLRRVALSSRDSSKTAAAQRHEHYPSRPSDPYGPHVVVRTGEPQLISEITESMLVAAAHNDEHLNLLRLAGFRSLVAVPIKAGARIVGALTFMTAESQRRYGTADLALAQELAYRAGIAIENARLYSDLQRTDQQKDEFLAVLSHELRNPLAPMRTALQLIRLAPDDRERRSRACEVMDRQLLQMVRLVDDLLDMSRITRGKIELQRERVELGAIIHDAVETSRPLIEAAGHELTVVRPPAPVHLDADTTRLAQVFSNLLNNAAKYTPRGGRISIEVDSEGPNAVVHVRDTGIGIPPHMLTTIFEMFTQVDSSLEKTHGGLGIGLTLAKRLIEMHGGTIVARSGGAGRGSEFIVSLPLCSAKPVTGMAGAGLDPSHAPSASQRILVVDDNQDAAECLAEMLRLKGHVVETAHDGERAIGTADGFQPDVVLLDLGMPRLNGYDTARHLKSRLPHVVLIAITGWGQDEHRRRSREVGFDHHLVKPVDLAVLDTLLNSVSGAV